MYWASPVATKLFEKEDLEDEANIAVEVAAAIHADVSLPRSEVLLNFSALDRRQ